MKISVFGLGYVGTVTGACLAELGHDVIGADINPLKVELIKAGKSPIVEKDIGEIIRKVVGNGTFKATENVAEAVLSTDLALVCVGTPSRPNGSLELSAVRRVSSQIGSALRAHRRYFVVVVRSTVLPGTVEDVVIPILERRSGKKAGRDFGVCMNPEFLREGTSVHDILPSAQACYRGARSKRRKRSPQDLSARGRPGVQGPHQDRRNGQVLR